MTLSVCVCYVESREEVVELARVGRFVYIRVRGFVRSVSLSLAGERERESERWIGWRWQMVFGVDF